MSKVHAVARVQVTLEFDASGWGADCTTGQVFKQAGDDLFGKLNRLLAHECKECMRLPQARLVGKPKVICVIFPDDSVTE